MEPSFQKRTMPRHTNIWLAVIGAIATLVTLTLTGSAQAQPPMATEKTITNTSTSTSTSTSSTSATGGRIAFASRRNGQPISVIDIYTMLPDGSDVRRVTTGNGVQVRPSISPDGTRIAYLNGGNSICLINSDGTHFVQLQDRSEFPPAWSPDGQTIAYGNLQDSEIHVINADGTNDIARTSDHTNSRSPTWSPDGTRIAFSNTMRDGDDNVEIYIMNADGSNPHKISDPGPDSGLYDLLPDWSPDGAHIAFLRGSGSDGRVYTMDQNGGNITPVTGGGDLFPTWSPDGEKIAYQHESFNPFVAQIHIVNADGSNDAVVPNSSQFDLSPNWQRHADPVVLVLNAQGTPVPNAQVWRNSQGAGNPSTFVGTTNMNGTVSLPSPQLNEYLIARSLVYTGTTQKAAHDDWAYHVWATNITQDNIGSQSAFIITNTNQLTQTLVVTTTSPLIGFNIVASVEFNATPDELALIAQGFSGKPLPTGYYLQGASDYLLDVTDGQMFFEQVTIYEDDQHWNDADYQFFADYLRADTSHVGIPTNSLSHIHIQASGDYGTPWDQLSAYSTLIHEFGHYAIGAYDEYFYHQDGDAAMCNLTPDPDYDLRASIMWNQRNSSEFCTIDNHNEATHQQIMLGEAVWQTLQHRWTDPAGRWTILTPNNRGFFDPGPLIYISNEAQRAEPTIVPVSAASCAPIMVTVLGITGSPVQTATLSLQHNGYVIDEGTTDINGQRLVYGAVSGHDKVTVLGPGFSSHLLSGSADITSCGAITIPLSIFLDTESSQADTQWPTNWLTATANYSLDQVNTSLHFTADPPAQPILYASQGGINRQQIPLAYNSAQHNYTGTYALNPDVITDFQFEVGLTGTNGLELFPYRFNASQFHSSGPAEKSKNDPPFVPEIPTDWDILGPESPTNLSVKPGSMTDGTGVMAGEVRPPADPPNNLLLVGGPMSVQGQNPIVGAVRLSMAYQAESYCGLQPGSIQIYRYNGTGWDALTTLINEDWHGAAADITQWGIYGVFAQPNSQTVFSDVPSGSTFYTYINWITCHGIASGYSEGTFRPSNNASRGQISKMMALTYEWHLDPPSGQAGQADPQKEMELIKWQWNIASDPYTFADVPSGSTFFLYVEAAYREGVVSGYPCGGPGEPCDSASRPYFRPSANVTRGQIAKIISNGSRFTDTISGQTFEDVAPGSTFYDFIGRMASREIINGYPCGGPGEPCGTGNRPYFRPSNNATRGQLSKMIYLADQPR